MNGDGFMTWGWLSHGGPQVTMGFNTKSWSFMTWMIWGVAT